jgi:hypothetical protein
MIGKRGKNMRINEIDDELEPHQVRPGKKYPLMGYNAEPGWVETIVPLLEKNCSNVISGMREAKKFLYRGIKNQTSAVFIGKSRKDRQPMSSTSEFHANINMAFVAAGLKANRSNSIFCTSNLADSAGYGESYMIFPVNGFHFTWSPRISDLYVQEVSLWGDDQGAYEKRVKFFREANPSEELIEEFLAKAQYKNTDLGAAIMSGNEIMISGTYYAVKSQYKDYPEFRRLLRKV